LRSTENNEGKRALAVAMGMLARRDMSSAEVARRLTVKGFPAMLAGDVVSRLQAAGYLDDRRFAQRWAESSIRNGRGFGPRLRFELARLRVPDAIADEVLASISAEYDEIETLSAILAKKFPNFAPPSATDREKNRIIHYLQRRGFSTAAIFQAFRNKQLKSEG